MDGNGDSIRLKEQNNVPLQKWIKSIFEGKEGDT